MALLPNKPGAASSSSAFPTTAMIQRLSLTPGQPLKDRIAGSASIPDTPPLIYPQQSPHINHADSSIDRTLQLLQDQIKELSTKIKSQSHHVDKLTNEHEAAVRAQKDAEIALRNFNAALERTSRAHREAMRRFDELGEEKKMKEGLMEERINLAKRMKEIEEEVARKS